MPIIIPPAAMGAAAAAAASIAIPAALSAGKTLMSRLVKAVQNGSKISSLADFSMPSRVEPLVLVDAPLAEQPYMTDILKFSLTTFSGYYMQAAALVQPVGKINTLKVLDQMNPNRAYQLNSRSVRDAIKAGPVPVFSGEAFQDGLPALETFDTPLEPNLIVSVENLRDEIDQVRLLKEHEQLNRARYDSQRAKNEAERSGLGLKKSQDEEKKRKEKEGIQGVRSSDPENTKKFYEIENLAVGKLLNIEFQDGDNRATVPVMIRLIPTKVPSKVLTHIFTATTKNSSWKERYHLWRAGQISLVRDLIFSVDLVDQHRKALINDTSNVYAAITDRRRKNLLSSGLTNSPSMADASNIAVISKETAKQISREMAGRLENLEVRKKLFNATYLILLVVVDEQWERVTIYHRGLDMPTELSFREIKSAEKGKGPDITEILKAYQLGSTPTI